MAHRLAPLQATMLSPLSQILSTRALLQIEKILSQQCGSRILQGSDRRMMASKPGVASQLVSVHIKPEREQGLHAFWTAQRGVQSPAMLARLRNFAGIYPRYRDLGYLKQTMTAWDAAIQRRLPHDRGTLPANNLARRHPFVIQMRIPPRHWSEKASRASLPNYSWKIVLSDIQRDIGQANHQRPEEEPSASSGTPAFVASADWGF